MAKKKGLSKKQHKHQSCEEIKNTAQEVNEKEVFPRSEEDKSQEEK